VFFWLMEEGGWLREGLTVDGGRLMVDGQRAEKVQADA
jgi:hypothetical protein